MTNARTYLPGAVDAALKLELFNVYDEFFKSSNSWQDTATIRTAAGRTNYDVVCGEPGAILRLISLVDNDGLSVHASMPTPGELVLAQTPTTAQTLTATVSLTVVDPTDSNSYPFYPSWLLSKYGSEILSGLLGRMMSQPAKPYSSERLSVFHLRRFRDAIAQAKSEARHQYLFGGQRWVFPKFASGRQR